MAGHWGRCAGVPVEDRGFRYGMSVFETVAICRGRPIFLEDHLERLGRAADAMGWGDVAVPGIPEEGAAPQFTGVVRLYITAGPGSPSDSFCGSAYALFEECEVGTDFPPVRAASSPAPYLPGPGGWKTGNYWRNVDAWAAAKRTGAGDALLFNPSGALACASMANVFLEIDGAWQTPALEAGARDGVVRAWVRKEMPVEEALIGADAVGRSTAGFLTSSRIGARPISEIDGRPLRTDIAELQRLYRNHVL